MMLLNAFNLFLVGWQAPGPMDGFRANFAAISARVEYQYESGVVDAGAVSGERFWENGQPMFRKARSVIRGVWECDDETQRCFLNPAAWGKQPTSTPLEGGLVQVPLDQVSVEMLSRDRLLAVHQNLRPRIDVLYTDRFSPWLNGMSPF